jgi:heme oxygenase (biliverdin-producing, ferredoxin)
VSILRDYTNDKHREAEARPFVQYMLGGGIIEKDYILFLQQMYNLYGTIEYFAEMSGLLHDLPDIRRAEYIREDLTELGATTAEALPATRKYQNRIIELYHSNQREQILAHVYVRHMGDMYGGKIIARKVPGSGRAYGFEDRPAVIKALDAKLTVNIVDEALVGFDLSMGIFDELWELMKNDNGS